MVEQSELREAAPAESCMRMIRKLQCILLKPGVTAEVTFFNKLLGVYS